MARRMPISRVRCTTLIDSTLAMPKATDTATKNEIIAVDRLCERSAFISCALVSHPALGLQSGERGDARGDRLGGEDVAAR